MYKYLKNQFKLVFIMIRRHNNRQYIEFVKNLNKNKSTILILNKQYITEPNLCICLDTHGMKIVKAESQSNKVVDAIRNNIKYVWSLW